VRCATSIQRVHSAQRLPLLCSGLTAVATS